MYSMLIALDFLTVCTLLCSYFTAFASFLLFLVTKMCPSCSLPVEIITVFEGTSLHLLYKTFFIFFLKILYFLFYSPKDFLLIVQCLSREWKSHEFHILSFSRMFLTIRDQELILFIFMSHISAWCIIFNIFL